VVGSRDFETALCSDCYWGRLPAEDRIRHERAIAVGDGSKEIEQKIAQMRATGPIGQREKLQRLLELARRSGNQLTAQILTDKLRQLSR
jgi:hypothetical protein